MTKIHQDIKTKQNKTKRQKNEKMKRPKDK